MMCLFPKLYDVLVYLVGSRNKDVGKGGLDQAGGAPVLRDLLGPSVLACG